MRITDGLLISEYGTSFNTEKVRYLFATGLYILSILPLYSQVIAPSDSRITTHQLRSGNVVLGISAHGGGYINMLNLPGQGDIMGFASDRYGRGGQSAMRDRLHGGRYNPTQAGFHETLGTPSVITMTGDSMVINPRMCALWHGDGKYDYIRWENIGADPYGDDGGNSDIDLIDEEDLEGQQLTEVGSEFDYYGVYENYMGRQGINIPCFRHYYEYRFIREPGHCLSQFGPGTAIYNESQIVDDISQVHPEGVHEATATDISGLIKVWSLRNDRSIWDPPYRHIITSQGNWLIQNRTDDLPNGDIHGPDAIYQPLMIISDSPDRDRGTALGLYRPDSEINTYVIVGRQDSTGIQLYKDDRTNNVKMVEQPARAPALAKYGFSLDGKGILSPLRTDSGVYEVLRSEFYILVGSPDEIFEAANAIHELTLLPPRPDQWNFDVDLEDWELTKSLGGAVKDSVLFLEIQGPDPYMTSPTNLQISAKEKNQIQLSMRNETSTTSGKIFWMRDTDKAFSPENSLAFELIADDTAFTTYSIDLADHANWTGTISRLRLDPSNDADSGSIRIDFIRPTFQETSSVRTHTIPANARVYPVPFKNYFTVEVNSPSNILISGMDGRMVCRRDKHQSNEIISSAEWTPGLYLVRVVNKQGIGTYKIIKE